jgi:AraC-like DNA-binding protein
MNIRYDIEKTKKILSDLSALTGISMSFLDTKRNRLCLCGKEDNFCKDLQSDPKKKAQCSCSDAIILDRCFETKRFEGHICHAGLYDAAMPIMKDGIFAGIILMGRIRLAGNGEHTDVIYREIPEFTREQVQSLSSLLPNVLFENAIFIEFDDRINEITTYIENHLSEPLRINMICKKFLISKNTLYSLFREHFDMTVTEYITELRLKKAKKLLCETKATVYEIAEAVGIGNYTYFCRLFKKREGVCATEYREIQSNKYACATKY